MCNLSRLHDLFGNQGWSDRHGHGTRPRYATHACRRFIRKRRFHAHLHHHFLLHFTHDVRFQQSRYALVQEYRVLATGGRFPGIHGH